MMDIKLTIVVPIYNVEEYIEQCLQSLVSVNCIGKYEVLVIDDCGTDLSLQIAEEFISIYPNIFKLLRHEVNMGLSAARNSGLAQVESHYVMFVDSDDWLQEGIIEKLLNVLIKSSPDFLFFDFSREWINSTEDVLFLSNVKTNQTITEELYFPFLQKVPVTAWGKVFRTDIVKKFLFTEGIIFEDVAIIPLIMLKSKEKIYFPGAKYHYRQREGSIMSERRGELKSLFNAYNILLSSYDDVIDRKVYDDLIFILLRDWLINVRVAFREKKYEKSVELLDHGIMFFYLKNNSWIKNKHLIQHLSSNYWLSKLKIKLILSLIGSKIFKVIFLLNVNYHKINWKNAKPLVEIYFFNDR